MTSTPRQRRRFLRVAASSNLLHNALAYAPAGTPVSIGLDLRPDDEVRWWVENDGQALSAEQVDRLFQRFSRGEQGAAHSSSTGLGLYYVRVVAGRHGGAAGVECAAGRIRFWVSLPGLNSGRLAGGDAPPAIPFERRRF
ncbi:putative Histidine kinase [Candidatus Accumulibacter aalborgensis]|uniref:histidine kinase n=1 Tax=Candidatus Accumulibacter aalborgensis TaxID=1860102 RepID=A0A1A8XU30_9PROT|nr:putative Histidine kinase [Candidatus Accumulibacter aalborgensis]